MQSFGLTMAFAIMVSMLVSFSLTPMMSARMLKPTRPQREDGAPGAPEEPTSPAAPQSGSHGHGGGHGGGGFIFGPMERGYTALLGFLLDHRWIVGLAIAGTMFSMIPLGKAVKVGVVATRR